MRKIILNPADHREKIIFMYPFWLWKKYISSKCLICISKLARIFAKQKINIKDFIENEHKLEVFLDVTHYSKLLAHSHQPAKPLEEKYLWVMCFIPLYSFVHLFPNNRHHRGLSPTISAFSLSFEQINEKKKFISTYKKRYIKRSIISKTNILRSSPRTALIYLAHTVNGINVAHNVYLRRTANYTRVWN